MPINTHASQDAKDKKAIRADTILSNFKTMTAQEINQYIDINVTDLESAKQVMKTLAKVVSYLARSI